MTAINAAPGGAAYLLEIWSSFMPWFVWFVIGAMSVFLTVLGLAALVTRGK